MKSIPTMSARITVLAALLLVAENLSAQAPHEEWRTVETKHFRVHYPARFEEWSLRAAARLESIRDAVVEEVGFAPPNRTEVLIANPIAQSNGFVYPLLDSPRMVLFVEPPAPDSVIGSYGNWIDLLTVHEITHLVHLLRPSRNPFQRLVSRVLPLSPIVLGSPPWVIEGYATVIEGRLTGFGRPAGSMRAAILRRLAQAGRLPTYEALSGTSEFLGRSLPYLGGSAFLEWLEARAGEESLRKLWARLSAREKRSFEEAFQGVFGESPARLYGEFAAELTSRAMRIPARSEGELWQETEGDTGDLAVSPNGKQIAAVVRKRLRPDRLVIWSTEAPTKETEKYEKQIAEILKRDPEDVRPVRTKPLPRDPVHELTMADGGDIRTPRWLPSGSLLFTHRQPDPDGNLHHDLFEWHPSTGDIRRITRLADTYDADPLPDGRRAVAVRSSRGESQLVMVDLSSGAVTPVTEASFDRVYAHPRVRADEVAYALNAGRGWQLAIRNLTTGTERIVEAPGDVASPEWGGDAVYATVMQSGFVEIYRFTLDGASHPVTEVRGAAFDPAPAADGRLFFMSLEPDGFVVRLMPRPAPVASRTADASLVPAVSPARTVPRAFASIPLNPRDYGFGPQEFSTLFGGYSAPDVRVTEAGARLGDSVGRFDLLALGSFGSRQAARGGAVAAAWRGFPVALSAHLFSAREGQLDHGGAELRAARTIHLPRSRIAVEGGGLIGDRNRLFASAGGRTRHVRQSARFEQEAEISLEGGESDHHGRMVLRSTVVAGSLVTSIRLQSDRASDDMISLGGTPSSILPRSLLADRVLDPALPPRFRFGDSYSGVRADAGSGLLRAFWQRHRLSEETISLAGIDLSVAIAPFPLLKLPGFELKAGVARILDGALRNRTQSWIGATYQP